MRRLRARVSDQAPLDPTVEYMHRSSAPAELAGMYVNIFGRKPDRWLLPHRQPGEQGYAGMTVCLYLPDGQSTSVQAGRIENNGAFGAGA
jgi:hypothetical protein